MKRLVDEDAILAALDSGLEEGRLKKASGPQRRKIIRESVAVVLAEGTPEDEIPIPPLLGLKEASEMLGTKKQYIIKLQNKGELTPVQRPSSGPVFRRSDVEKYLVQLEEARRLREERAEERAAKEEAAAAS